MTPPVALAAFAGAGIAGGDPNQTGFISLKLAGAGILVPYVFVYAPALLMQNAAPGEIIWVSITTSIGIVALGIAFEGYYFTAYLYGFPHYRCSQCSLTLVIPGVLTDTIGLCLFIALTAAQIVRRKRNTVSTA